ncbi:hydroxymethylbilane synthase [Telmatospirillum sp. J64-1]|uniref:hydroxymethylbilane synthase n=1 Tax=Telmatospirillum sp. J64-1 TaxID=2502183 RepID=UPI00115C48F0|nr:hydroxymethylbilane synthase [Telmatospirillum sp. J64-1]
MTSRALRIGTRGSPLALAQAHETRDRLMAVHPALRQEGAIEIVALKTTGDIVQDRPLAEIGGKGLFTKELDEALADGRIDIAVHSMKDVATALPYDQVLACVLPREDVRDAFISYRAQSLDELPPGSRVGTSSLRRAAQILNRRPDLEVVGFRGNVQTRLRKLREGVADATLLAMAGLNRLEMSEVATAPLDSSYMLPAVAQGAIGITCRCDDQWAIDLVTPLEHEETRYRITAERAFLRVLDGSCRTPIAGLAELDGQGGLSFRGLVVSPDGQVCHRIEDRGAAREAEAIGERAARDVLLRLEPGFFDFKTA